MEESSELFVSKENKGGWNLIRVLLSFWMYSFLSTALLWHVFPKL